MFEADNAITTHQLGLALRAMGQNPSEGEIQSLAASAELNGTGRDYWLSGRTLRGGAVDVTS